jgi:Tol biopolymer transport system component
MFEPGKLFVVPAGGGQPTQLQSAFPSARYPVWAPDGKHILFDGFRAGTDSPQERDWFVTPLDGGPAIKTGAFSILRSRGITVYLGAGSWRGGEVLFSGRAADTRSLYQIDVSPDTFRATGGPERLTVGTGVDAEPFARNGTRVVFTSANFHTSLWSVGVDSRGQTANGPMERLTEGERYDANPGLSADGSRLVFLSNRFGTPNVWMKDLRSGREAALTASPWGESSPVTTSDGSKVAYATLRGGKQEIDVVAPAALPGSSIAQKVCDDCGLPAAWYPDASRLLYVHGDPPRIGLLELATGKQTGLLELPRGRLSNPQFSPDGRWIAVVGQEQPGATRIYLIPFRDDRVPGEKDWIPFTAGDTWDDHPHWSPDGALLYFYSKRDGFGCIWRQRFDLASGRVYGEPVAARHFHSSRLSMVHLLLSDLGISVARDKLVFNLSEVTGSIWALSTGPPHTASR